MDGLFYCNVETYGAQKSAWRTHYGFHTSVLPQNGLPGFEKRWMIGEIGRGDNDLMKPEYEKSI